MPNPPISSSTAANPANPVNDMSGAPRRTRFPPPEPCRILFTTKVPFPFGDQRLRHP